MVKKPRKWTSDEDAIMRAEYPGKGAYPLMEKLDRTYLSVTARASELGLRFVNRRYPTPKPAPAPAPKTFDPEACPAPAIPQKHRPSPWPSIISCTGRRT